MDALEQGKIFLLGSRERAENDETRHIRKMLDEEETARKERDASVAQEMEILGKRLEVADMASEQLLPTPPRPQP
jgi:polyhydroxyalkanoate synthesis regulator phasin